MKVLLLIPIIFLLYIIYSVTRMFIDPDYRDRMEKQAYRYRNRRRSSSYDHWYKESHNHIHGMFKYRQRDAYARRQADKELRKYIKSIK